VTIDFPRYTRGQLAAIFVTLVAEAGFIPGSGTADKASAVLEKADGNRARGSARLAVQLLEQVTVNQALRIPAIGQIENLGPWQ
jgi:hypothetical protein